jgi:2-iminobutanoate/2-iminopropanoate deaminase
MRGVRSAVRTDEAPPPGGSYSQAIRWGDLLFVSGQTPRDLDRQPVGGSFRAQAERTYANLRAVVEAGGATMASGLQLNVYLQDFADAAVADEVFAEVFPEPRPARTTVASEIPVSIEIDGVFGIVAP